MEMVQEKSPMDKKAETKKFSPEPSSDTEVTCPLLNTESTVEQNIENREHRRLQRRAQRLQEMQMLQELETIMETEEEAQTETKCSSGDHETQKLSPAHRSEKGMGSPLLNTQLTMEQNEKSCKQQTRAQECPQKNHVSNPQSSHSEKVNKETIILQDPHEIKNSAMVQDLQRQIELLTTQMKEKEEEKEVLKVKHKQREDGLIALVDMYWKTQASRSKSSPSGQNMDPTTQLVQNLREQIQEMRIEMNKKQLEIQALQAERKPEFDPAFEFWKPLCDELQAKDSLVQSLQMEKDEVLRKLEAATQNQMQKSDSAVVQDLHNQIQLLQIQMKEKQDENETLKNAYNQHCDQTNEAQRSLSEQLQAKDSFIQRLQAEKEAEFAQLKEAMQKDLESANKTNACLRESLKNQELREENTRTISQDLQKQIQQLTTQHQAEREKLLQELKSQSVLSEQLKNTQAALCRIPQLEMEGQMMKKEIIKLQSALQEAQRTAQTLEEERVSLQTSIHHFKMALSKEQRDAEDARSKVTEQEEELRTQKASAQDSDQKLKSAQDTFKAIMEKCHSRYTTVTAEKETMERQVQDLSRDIEALKWVHSEQLSAMQCAEKERREAMQSTILDLSTALSSSQNNNQALLSFNQELQESLQTKELQTQENMRRRRRWWFC